MKTIKIVYPLGRISATYLIMILIFLISCTSMENEKDYDKEYDNKEITPKDFSKSEKERVKSNIVEPNQPLSDSMKLIDQGYVAKELANGNEPGCYNFNRDVDLSIENKLEIEVGTGTDVVIKMMSKKTEKCIRYFFINHGSTYEISNIPEGRYYLKIGYGKSWMLKKAERHCIGRFLQNASYQLGEDILDYNVQRDGNNLKIPSYKLSLDVIAREINNNFNAQNISEDDFNQ